MMFLAYIDAAEALGKSLNLGYSVQHMIVRLGSLIMYGHAVGKEGRILTWVLLWKHRGLRRRLVEIPCIIDSDDTSGAPPGSGV